MNGWNDVGSISKNRERRNLAQPSHLKDSQAESVCPGMFLPHSPYPPQSEGSRRATMAGLWLSLLDLSFSNFCPRGPRRICLSTVRPHLNDLQYVSLQETLISGWIFTVYNLSPFPSWVFSPISLCPQTPFPILFPCPRGLSR